LETFQLPVTVEANAECELLGEQMIDAWLKDGIFRVKMCSEQNDLLRSSYAHSKSYFKLSDQKKTMELNKNGFAGYLRQPHQEHLRPFTLSKDLPLIDTGLQEGWLWDGRCPFPTAGYKDTMKQLSYLLNKSGQKLLQLIGLGLGLENPNALLRLTERGWHHMRILRFPPLGETNAKTEIRLGRGSQRRRGLLILSSQDVGIFVRSFKTHDDNVTGYDENVFVPPIEGTLTVYPGK
jgi:isopenicillin N synthase-like dioxygenase